MTKDPRDTFWWRLIHLNPVLFRSALVSVISLLAMGGVLVSPALPDALTTAVASVGALVAMLWSRGGVTPMDKVVIYQPEPIDQPIMLAAGPATAPTSTSDASILREARREGPA